MINFSSKEYLPNSEERLAHLRKIINGRPVAILAAGPSIHELEERIEQLRQADICYFGINKFFVQETHILQKINKQMSVVSCGGREGMPEIISPVIDFFNRDEDNMFISSFWRDPFGLVNNFNLRQFLDRYDKKLLFFSIDKRGAVPNNNYPLHFIESNSLLMQIQMALIGQAQSIVLFGADGHGGEGSKKCYYRHDEYAIPGWSWINESLMNDTRHFFNSIAATAIKNTCKTYNLPLINILNCSPKSFYTPFPKISYDEAFEYLLTGKKLIGRLDLRVPLKPKTPHVCSLILERALSFLRRHRWNSLAVITVRCADQLMKILKNQRDDKANYARSS